MLRVQEIATESVWRMLLLNAVLCAVVLIAAVAESSKRLERVDRVLAVQVTAHDTLRVVVGIIRDSSRDWPDSSVESVRIVNRRGAYLYSDTFFVRNGADGPLYAHVGVDAWPVKWTGGVGFRLRDENQSPRFREHFGPDYHCRFFAVRGDTLVSIVPWCALCGELLSGDRIIHRVSLSRFVVDIPLRVRFDLPTGGLELAPIRDPAADNLAVLETTGACLHWGPEDPSGPKAHLYPSEPLRRAFLYRSAIGSDGDSISVTQKSVVRFGRAYVECAKWAGLGDHCPDDLKIEFKRLEFTADGRHGFLDEAGMQSLGSCNPGAELHFRGPGTYKGEDER